ncbi:integrase [Paraburkholderia sp. MM6662-R1]|uniref:integrase n=1 Tax=Paraburkholderia sp. MM6662-R1 TaxID=2991066 RepID=UPI003D21C1C7
MSDEKARKRKSMAAVGSVIGLPCDNWIANQGILIALSKMSNPFLHVTWEDPVWDVTASYESRDRGYKSNGTPHNLLFTQHSQKAPIAGEPLAGTFGDVVKSLVCARHSQRGQSVPSHMVFVRATRYVYDALKSVDYDISLITPAHLDLAAAAIFKREAEVSAYKAVGHMEEFADMLDANGLCRLRLDWRCRRKVRPEKLRTDRIEDVLPVAEPDDRLPKEEAIRAVGWLYQNIRSEDPASGVANPDRIAILITTILVCTGLRIGEVLTLPEDPLLTERDGTRSLRYARLKGRRDHVTVEWKVKPLLSATVELVEGAIRELHELTDGARNVARSFSHTGRLLVGKNLKPVLGPVDVRRLVGLESKNVAQFLKQRKIPYEVLTKRVQVRKSDFLAGIARDHWSRPMLRGPKGKGLELHQALCVVYTNQMHRGTLTTLLYAAQPVADLQIRDFLTARTGTRNIFERSGIVDADGQPIEISSKGFRHFLNNLLDEGGAPDMVQTKWFGRKNPSDTRAYQHLTPAQRARKVVDDIMAGKVEGKVTDIAKVLPTEVARGFLLTRVQAVHDVGPGMCVHDFQMMPCPKYLECTADCDEYVWEKGDLERKDALLRQMAFVQGTIRAALSRKAAGGIVKSDWWKHLKTKYRQLLKQMKSSGLKKSDIDRYIAENGLDRGEELSEPVPEEGR